VRKEFIGQILLQNARSSYRKSIIVAVNKRKVRIPAVMKGMVLMGTDSALETKNSPNGKKPYKESRLENFLFFNQFNGA
jgi:hypothetical protein